MRPWTAALGMVVGCTQAVGSQSSPPTSTTYQLRFPSAAVAVASDTLEVMVFDASVPGADCLSLAIARKSGEDLPASPVLLRDTGAVSTCTLEQSQGQSTFDVTYGARSFLAIAQRDGRDFFLGCTQATLAEGGSTIDIWLAESSIGTMVPATSCTLSQKCGGAGGC